MVVSVVEYSLDPSKGIKVLPIPLRRQERGVLGKGLASLTLIADEAKAYPDKLSIYIGLGRTSTKQLSGNELAASQVAGDDKP